MRKIVAIGTALVMVLTIFTAFLVVVPTIVSANPSSDYIEVTQPSQVSDDSHYERGESIAYNGSGYWLFYGRHTSITGHYGDSNPDDSNYEIYHKKASSISGLETASASMVTGADNIYQGQTSCVYSNGEVWVFAADETSNDHSIKAWKTTDGSSWTEHDTGFKGCSAPHLWAIVYNDGGTDKIFLVYNAPGGKLNVSTYQSSSGWSTPTQATTHEGMPRFYEDSSGDLHLIWTSWGLDDFYIHTYNSGWNTDPDYTIPGTPDDDCDPSLFQIDGNGDYCLMFAPWDGTQQYLAGYTASSLSGLETATSHTVTKGGYESTPWVDMCPIAFDDSGDVYLFFTSERKPDGTRGTGNISYMEVEWDTYKDHYTYIQNGIDAVTSEGTVKVYEGNYLEALYIDKSLTLEAASNPIINGSQSVITNYGPRDALIFVEDATNVLIEGFDIEGEGLGSTNTKSYAVIYEESGGTIKDCNVSPNTIGDMYSTAIAAWDGSDLTVDTCSIEDYGRIGIFYYNSCTGGVYDSSLEGQVYSDDDEVCYGIEVEGLIGDSDPNTASQITIKDNEIYNHDNTFSPEPLWGSAGIYVNGWLAYYPEADSTAIIEGNDIHDNYDGIYVVKSSTSFAHHNKIEDSRNYGAYHNASYDGTTTVFDAKKNWWSDATGPIEVDEVGSEENPHGSSALGDNVSDYVDFIPWYATNTTTSSTEYVSVEHNPIIAYSDTIQGGIDAAVSSSTVLVSFGEYHQSVVFYGDDSSITLQCEPGTILDGDAPADLNCILTYDAITLQAGANNITIEGFEIRDYRDSGNGQGNAIQAWNSGTSYITVRDNVMHGFSWNAVLVGNEGQGLHDYWTVSDNTIYDADAYTLELTNCVDSMISGNIITHSAGEAWGNGITISAQNHQASTTLTVDDLLIEDNLIDGTDPSETNCGIYVIAWSPGTDAVSIINDLDIEDNIVANANRDIMVWSFDPDNGDQVNLPMVTRNIVSNSGDRGIFLRSTNGGTVSGNVVTDSDGSDIEILDSNGIEVSDNVASGSDKAINVSDCTNIVIEGNVVSDAEYGIWAGDGSSSITVEDNVVSTNMEGIKVDSTGDISIFNNVAEGNTLAGIYVYDNTDVVSVRYNIVSENECWGVLLESCDYVLVEYNMVVDNIPSSYVWGNGGVGLLSSDYNAIKNNDIMDNWIGVYMENSDHNDILNNYIYSNNWPDETHWNYGGLGIAVWEYGSDRSDYNTIQGNWIEDHDRNAVLFGVDPSAGGYNIGNKIIDNTALNFSWYGLELTNSQDGVIEGNTVYNPDDNRQCYYPGEAGIGILVQGWGSGALADDNTVEGNTIHSYLTQGIRLLARENANANDNTFTENRVYDVRTGIRVSNYAPSSMTGNDIVKNFISDVIEDGIYINYTITTTVKNNQVNTGGGTGIYAKEGTINAIESNHVSGFNTGIHATETTDVEVSKNVVTENDVGILSAGANSGLSIDRNNIRYNDIGVKLESDATGDTVEFNVISDNTNEGVLVEGNGNSIFRNTVRHNGNGIKVEGNANSIGRNVGNNNDKYGFWATSSANSNYFYRNVGMGNGIQDARDDNKPNNTWYKNIFGSGP